MSNIEFKINEKEDITVLEFVLPSGVINPENLKEIEPPDAVKSKFSNKLVVISGRGPIWLYCYLTHFYHVCKAIAVFDPRLQAAVVVQTHDDSHKNGDLIPIE
ncbi:MAG: CRISPR-associated protein Csx3 [Candidatus Methanofastidiosum sp.]|nr:CRISPR-associated protein Csx3 [Methanofastidiosum sp.]